MDMLEAILLTIVTAATPLLLAAHRRARGRALRRAQSRRRGHDGDGRRHRLRRRARHRLAVARRRSRRSSPARCSALLFGFLTLTLVANQVATGLALTLLGLGLSGMIGECFVGQPGVEHAAPAHSRAERPARSSARSCSARIRSSTCRPAHRRRGLVPVPHPRRPDPARGRRQPRLGACARHLGHRRPLSRRAVRRRLRRPRRRLSVARLHAAVGGEHDGRPRLDRAGAGGLRLLAALAGAGRRLSVRRRHHPPAASAQALAAIRDARRSSLSALPYLATILVLVLISRNRR